MGKFGSWLLKVLQNLSAALVVIAFFVAVAAVLRFLWIAGTTPSIVATFAGAPWLQAVATIFTAFATIALWIVTARLSRVTSIQVHAQTSPLLFALAYFRHDPPLNQAEEQLPFPGYNFESEDQGEPEMNMFHQQFDADMQAFEKARRSAAAHDKIVQKAREQNRALPAGLGARPEVPSDPRKAYLLVHVGNGQTASAYGFATNIEVDVVLVFPRYSTVKGATASTQFSPGHMLELKRTLKVPMLAGQGNMQIAAFRVDAIPFWFFRVDAVRHLDYKGKFSTFAVGSRTGSFGPAGFTTEMGRWEPQKGEQPR